MNVAEVRIIPFVGKPLEYISSGIPRTLFSVPENGFLAGPENYLLERIVHWITGGGLPENILPITFFGPNNCGKTHLLQGINDACRKPYQSGNRKKRAYYLRAADFARQFAEAIDMRTVDDFRRRYREADWLILDDLAALVEKPAAQEELLFTLDALIANGNTVLLSDSQFPGENGRYSERLTARLLGGLTVPIALPGTAVRLRFLQELASAFRCPLPSAALEYAAKELSLSIPTLHGTFAQMFFEAKVEGAKLDTARLKTFLAKRLVETRPSIVEIAKKTAKHFALKLADLRGTSRTKTIAQARSVAVYLSRELTALSLKDIGKYFGGRDHTTIRHLVESVETAIGSDAVLRNVVLKLR